MAHRSRRRRPGKARRGFGRLAIGVAVALLGLACSSSVLAETSGSSDPSGSEQTGARSMRGQFGGWILSMQRGAPSSAYMCGEWSVLGGWSVLGCGSGSGVMYRPLPNETDLTHFRTQYTAPLFPAALPSLEVGPGVGLAEVQRGADESGFRFDPERDDPPLEAAGPEAALEVEWASRERAGPFESVRVKLDAGVAWIPGAPVVVETSSEVVPFSTLTVNGTF